MQAKGVKCEADEFPPAAFNQGNLSPKQYIRFNPGSQNGGAGSIFHLAFCGFNQAGDQKGKLPEKTLNAHYVSDRIVAGLKRSVFHYTAETTRSRVEIEFDGDVIDPDGVAGLQVNPCWPEKLLEDPGFALLTDDPYYKLNNINKFAGAYGKKNYPGPIPSDVLSAASVEGHFSQEGFRKRGEDLHNLDPDAWIFNDGNSTRRLTDAELQEKLGILRCSLADCKEEMLALGLETAIVVQPTATAPSAQLAASTTQVAVGTVLRGASAEASAGSHIHGMLMQPRVTGYVETHQRVG